VNETAESGRPDETAGQEKSEKIQLPGDVIAILPLRNTILFPSTVLPLAVGRPGSIQAIDEAVRQQLPVGIIAQKDAAIDAPGPQDLYDVGTAANIVRMMATPDGQRQIVVQGRQRFKVVDFVQTEPFPVAKVDLFEEAPPESKDFEARVLQLRTESGKALTLLPQPMPDLKMVLDNIEDPVALIDLIASTLDIPLPEKQEILATFDVEDRARKIAEKLAHQIELLELSKKMGAEVKGSMDKAQREYFLREQLKAIQKELGEDDAKSAELAELRDRIDAAQMPEAVEKEAVRELSRLERIPEAAGEYSVIRTYIDWLLDLPWNKRSDEQIDLNNAGQILDADHHDLEKVKKRIIEFLAVRKLKPHGKSPILCFVGPPGVGKTSLGHSIARAMNRMFMRISLGGVHDEAEIRGHRRTYVGAMPGNVMQAIRKAGTRNPVLMLDEVDKLSASFHGDPSAALLEVLDPSQNTTFQDHYLDVPFDLSQVLFIATANVLDPIPAPLRDRMEVLELPGYTEEDKIAIARRYLLPRQIEENGIHADHIELSDDVLSAIISEYTREAGVRQLERELGSICRGIAGRVAEGFTGQMTVTRESLNDYLGPAKFFNEVALRTSLPGVATGLAWTPFGGDILFVEATKVPGDARLLLTGQLGDVMKESAQAAFSLVKSRAKALGIDNEAFRENELHVHLPAGAIPKDGPSAGITLFVTLVSLLTGRRVRADVAMTGEISLRGLVLPVGGIKEKVIAAKRAGISSVLLPELNRKDLEDVPPSVRNTMVFHFLRTIDDALGFAFESGEPDGKANTHQASPGAATR